MRKPKYSAQFIADWFVSRANHDVPNRSREPLSVAKLMNLMYVAQGIYLSVRGVPLFDGEICRGFDGPTVVAEFRGTVFDVKMKPSVGNVLAKSKADNAFLEMIYLEVGKVDTKKLLSRIKSCSAYKMTEIGDTIDMNYIKIWCENIFLKDID